ncbi:LemA family protein [Candidatus Micrarchaeota archaeon]|nr:LemA family protein [Candidatus Micrarchaeota archaeon]
MLEWIGLGILVLLVLLILVVIGTYNRLVVLRNRIDNAWSQIDVQLKRRYDLIPNLVETVKGYAKHEKETLKDVIKYRGGLVNGSAEDRTMANNMLTAALGRLFAVSENYPQLRANENFLKLQEELTGTENKISYVRTAYNDSVLELNNGIQTFPSNMIAGMFGFTQKPYLETPGEERKNVKVKFE